MCIKDLSNGIVWFTKGKTYRSDSHEKLTDELGKSIIISKEHLVHFMEITIKAPDHYNNEKGSLYKIAQDRNWNAYVFDVVKRLDRGGKKDPLKQEIEKSIFVLQLWLKELEG